MDGLGVLKFLDAMEEKTQEIRGKEQISKRVLKK